MPFYEYRRPDGSTLEVMQKMSDPPLTRDPETGVALERVFHPIAVHFKGKGFYNTDYGTKNRQRENAAEEGSKKSESGAGETAKSGETKSAGESGSGSSSSGGEPSASPGSDTGSGGSAAGGSGVSGGSDGSGGSSSRSADKKSSGAGSSSDR